MLGANGITNRSPGLPSHWYTGATRVAPGVPEKKPGATSSTSRQGESAHSPPPSAMMPCARAVSDQSAKVGTSWTPARSAPIATPATARKTPRPLPAVAARASPIAAATAAHCGSPAKRSAAVATAASGIPAGVPAAAPCRAAIVHGAVAAPTRYMKFPHIPRTYPEPPYARPETAAAAGLVPSRRASSPHPVAASATWTTASASSDASGARKAAARETGWSTPWSICANSGMPNASCGFQSGRPSSRSADTIATRTGAYSTAVSFHSSVYPDRRYASGTAPAAAPVSSSARAAPFPPDRCPASGAGCP
jgi:hypothetical protein